jgi:hypothetical protein
MLAPLLFALLALPPEDRDHENVTRYIAGCKADYERQARATDAFFKGTRKGIVDKGPVFSETLPVGERRLARAACQGWLDGVIYMTEKPIYLAPRKK